MFPTNLPAKANAVVGDTMVRVRVSVSGKGVARRGAALWADDLSADQMRARADDDDDDDTETTPEPSADPVTGISMEGTGEAVADQSAQPTDQPMAEAAALGHVTSEVPRGAARGAGASALCSAAAIQHLRWGWSSESRC